MKKTFPLLSQVCEVDVVEHPRFCDEFSHLMNRRLLLIESLCSGLISMEYMFERFLTFE